MDPAPPMTQTVFPLISCVNFSLFASISGTNMLTRRLVTLSDMNFSKLNIVLSKLLVFNNKQSITGYLCKFSFYHLYRLVKPWENQILFMTISGTSLRHISITMLDITVFLLLHGLSLIKFYVQKTRHLIVS